MKRDRIGVIAVLSLCVLLVPPALFAAFVFAAWSGGLTWEQQRAGGNIDLLFELTLPALFVGAGIVLRGLYRHRDDGMSTSADEPDTSVERALRNAYDGRGDRAPKV
jgi:hypothetical protein